MMAMLNSMTNARANKREITSLLQETVNFKDGIENVSIDEYYSIKYRMSEQTLGSISQSRAGYIYLLVKRKNNVPVAHYYDNDNNSLDDCDTSFYSCVTWQPEDLF